METWKKDGGVPTLLTMYLKEGWRPCLLIHVILLEETFAQPGRTRRVLVYVGHQPAVEQPDALVARVGELVQEEAVLGLRIA